MKKMCLILVAFAMGIGLSAQNLPQEIISTELSIFNSDTEERFLVKELTNEILERWFGIPGVYNDETHITEYRFNIRQYNNPRFAIVALNVNANHKDTYWRDLPQLKLYIPGIEQPISTGMTEAEIVAILGEPPKKSGNILFHYEGYGITRRFKISFEKQENGTARVLDISF